VEAEPADGISFVEDEGQAIDIGVIGECGVESGVEGADLRDIREQALRGADAFDVMWIVQWGEVDAVVQFFHNLFVDEDGGGESFTAVDDAMADGSDFSFIFDDAVIGESRMPRMNSMAI